MFDDWSGFISGEAGKKMFDSLPVAVFATDSSGQLKYCNSAAIHLSGQEPNTTISPWYHNWKFYYPDGNLMPHEQSPMAISLKEKRNIDETEIIAERPDGRQLWLQISATALSNGGDDFYGSIIILKDITKQKEAETKLRQINEEAASDQDKRLYEAIISSTTDLIYIFDLNYRFTFANEALLETWGRTPEEAIGKSLLELGYEPWHAEMHERELDQVISTKQPVQGEVEFPHSKLGMRSYDYIFVPVLDGSGEVEAIAGITRDITPRKQAEQALRKSEKKYRTLFEKMDDAFFILQVEFDADQKPVNFQYLETNPAFEKQTGLQNVIGKKVKEVLPDVEEDWINIYGQIALTGKPARFKNQVEELNSWFEVSAFRIGAPEERKVAAYFKNITQRKKAQNEREQLLREVRNERKKLEDIFKHAPSFMCILRGPEHIYERANDLYLELIGGRKVIGKTVREVFPDIEGQGYFDLLDQVYKTGEPFIGTDMKVVLQKEHRTEERYLDIVYQPLQDSDGSINGIFTQGVDLTDRKRAQEELKAINETLEQRVEERTKSLLSYQSQLRSLASQLSNAEENQRQQLASELHDNLGQLLALGKMKADLLQNSVSDDLSGSVTDLQEVLDGALRYTRELMTELKPPPSLTGDIMASIRWVAEKLKKRGLSVTIEDDEQPKPLDEQVKTTVYQSVRELLFNVIKHTSKKEAVVSVSTQNSRLQISVKDEGEGFELESKELNPDRGSKFGLFNVQERIDLLGGRVDINTKPGEGTEVIVNVPMAKTRKAQVASEQANELEYEHTPTTQNKPETGINVLIADDHLMFRKGLRTIIEGQDDIFVIGEAADGNEAINLARKTSPHIILMDINMPGMDGIEATIKITGEMPDIRIIGLSLHDDESVIEDIRNAGASAYLTKSEAFESLIGSIRAEASALKNKD